MKEQLTIEFNIYGAVSVSCGCWGYLRCRWCCPDCRHPILHARRAALLGEVVWVLDDRRSCSAHSKRRLATREIAKIFLRGVPLSARD